MRRGNAIRPRGKWCPGKQLVRSLEVEPLVLLDDHEERPVAMICACGAEWSGEIYMAGLAQLGQGWCRSGGGGRLLKSNVESEEW